MTGTPDREHARVFSEAFSLRPDNEIWATKNFSANRYIDPPYEMLVIRGAMSREVGPTPGTIILNGTESFTPTDFLEDIGLVGHVIDLLPENKLEIRNLKGPIGTRFSVVIRGERAPGYPGPLRPSIGQ